MHNNFITYLTTMTQSHYLDSFATTLRHMLDIVSMKNSDYSHEKDAFFNFSLSEKLSIASVEQGILIRMVDKIARISNIFNQGYKVKEEKITDTLLDLANYAIILKIYLESRGKDVADAEDYYQKESSVDQEYQKIEDNDTAKVVPLDIEKIIREIFE